MFELIREGSVKQVLRVDQESIAFRFTSNFSVFDVGRADYIIPGKAEAVCASAVRSFEIAEKIGVPTHFIEQVDPVTIRVREAQIFNRYPALGDENFLVPLEWIYRLKVAGSLHRDFDSGQKKPEEYGLPVGIGTIPKVGTSLPWPAHQLTTKFEKIDRPMEALEASWMSGLTTKDIREFWSMIDRLTGAIGLATAEAGFVLLDGKMECIMGTNRQKMIGDVFGTPDEDRFCPVNELAEGRVLHYSKEYLRQLFIAAGYYQLVQGNRKAGLADPPIPQLNDKEIAEASRRYIVLAEAYTGRTIEFFG